MSILDRYIARQFLTNFALLIVILFSFIVAIDATLNMSKFVRAVDAMHASAESVGGLRKAAVTLLVVTDYWWPRLLELFNYMLGLTMVAAMGFTCAQMVRARETVAILASGHSLRRVARPILMVATVMIGLQIVNQELVLPRIAPLLTRSHSDVGMRSFSAKRVLLVRDGQRRFWSAGSFDAQDAILHNLYLLETDELQQIRRLVLAPKAHWDGTAWILERGTVTTVPLDGSPPPPPSPIHRIVTDADPTALRISQYAGYSGKLSFRQLSEMIRAKQEGLDDGVDDALRGQINELNKHQWGRFGVAAANFLGVVICLPFFLVRVPRNMGMQSLKAAPVALATIMGGILASVHGISGVPPVIGVFVPVAVLLPMVLYALVSIRS
ncbi:MAG: LptF/LptG family permease [Phycisphaeraceae bacterium]|nr:LptF/LptG family permease [Phycisphaeraceae bacterium]